MTSFSRFDPLERAPRRARPKRRVARWRQWLARVLHLRRGFKVDGVYYKELSPMPLARALSQRGPGFKDYRVTYPDRSKQIIRCTSARVFADICGDRTRVRTPVLERRLRPGARVLELGCGTGDGASLLGQLVGPSGAVVAIGDDPQSVEYAQRRYQSLNIAFELHRPDSLSGETDESFDGVIIAGLTLVEDRDFLLLEAWRVLKAEAWLVAPLSDGRRLVELVRERPENAAAVVCEQFEGVPEGVLLEKRSGTT